jgi:FkbM family methyltransferase
MIFIDCGYHLGEGLREFTFKLNIDNTWEVHAFEPNPACNLLNGRHPFPVIFHKEAVWVYDGEITFRQEHQLATKSPIEESVDVLDGWGSCLKELNSTHTYEREINVKCIDFAKFVKQFEPNTVYCKMDIEGAEFSVLRHLLKYKVVDRFKFLWVEWHHQDLPSEDFSTANKLIQELQLHIPFENWK